MNSVQDVIAPSVDAIQPDHLSWWAGFTELISKMPRNAEQCRLSDAPIHRVHGNVLSIRDCARRAIDLAYEEGLDQVAQKYEEQADRLTASYDRHVRAKVSACMDKKMIKYMLITFGCAIFALILIAINSTREISSVGLLAIIGISLSVSLVAVALFVLLFIKKRKALGSGSQAEGKTGTEMP
jgi:hypothetical protein